MTLIFSFYDLMTILSDVSIDILARNKCSLLTYLMKSAKFPKVPAIISQMMTDIIRNTIDTEWEGIHGLSTGIFTSDRISF